ncbi:MAG: hypothetical protein ACM31L_07875, partial [Actinomycetota bacterium]
SITNKHRIPADTYTLTVSDWLITITRFSPGPESMPGVHDYDLLFYRSRDGATAIGAVESGSMAMVKFYALREAMRLDDEADARAERRDRRRRQRKSKRKDR